MFNEGMYQERAERGEFFEHLLKDDHPSPRRCPEPRCTRSQTIEYLDSEGRRVALVHQYLRRNGRLGGSGLPDPKLLFRNGTLYKLL